MDVLVRNLSVKTVNVIDSLAKDIGKSRQELLKQLVVDFVSGVTINPPPPIHRCKTCGTEVDEPICYQGNEYCQGCIGAAFGTHIVQRIANDDTVKEKN